MVFIDLDMTKGGSEHQGGGGRGYAARGHTVRYQVLLMYQPSTCLTSMTVSPGAALGQVRVVNMAED